MSLTPNSCRYALHAAVVPDRDGGVHDGALLGARDSEAGSRGGLMAPPRVGPYVRTDASDTRDAETLSEAVQRPTMRFA
jgi:hypothetical protein